jgi:hypothetical protein
MVCLSRHSPDAIAARFRVDGIEEAGDVQHPAAPELCRVVREGLFEEELKERGTIHHEACSSPMEVVETAFVRIEYVADIRSPVRISTVERHTDG